MVLPQTPTASGDGARRGCAIESPIWEGERKPSSTAPAGKQVVGEAAVNERMKTCLRCVG
jgi:hypothetical protein